MDWMQSTAEYVSRGMTMKIVKKFKAKLIVKLRMNMELKSG